MTAVVVGQPEKGKIPAAPRAQGCDMVPLVSQGDYWIFAM
jgi:hypothetical protein